MRFPGKYFPGWTWQTPIFLGHPGKHIPGYYLAMHLPGEPLGSHYPNHVLAIFPKDFSASAIFPGIFLANFRLPGLSLAVAFPRFFLGHSRCLPRR